MNSINWADLIKTLRAHLLLSQVEMAKLLKVSFSSVNRWENSKNEPTIKVKRKIKDLCKKHNITLEKE